MAFLNNPFVGPRPLTRDNPIFGRDREIAELRHLLTAERFVLLLSPSGAGKSSLVNAGLIPELNSRFDVWEPTRVNTPPPPGITTNRYVWSTIHGWKGDGPETELASFVAARPRRQNILLIFDQFEEILRLNPADNAGRTEFFRQLGELLQSPSIWALLVLREDYLAPLLPWLSRLPTHFRSRFRLGFLSPPSAAEAMHCTAATGGRHFQPDALRQLTSRLADETGVIEPMHLQVVCRRLWERMPDDDLSIDGVDIDQFAGVTTSLAEYYATSVAAIARQFQISERAIRDWFQKELITASQTRGQVQQGPECSGTLPTPVAEAFLQTHLIRVEPRRKDWWYELAHDRLLEPVFQSNDSWYRDNLNTTQQRAVLWIEQHKPDALLLGADDLPAALAWLNAANTRATPAESEFIEKSQQKHRAALHEQAQNRRLRLWLRLALGAIGMVTLLALLVVFQIRETRSQKLEADVALSRSKVHDARLAFAAGRPGHALAHLARAIRLDPNSTVARYWIADLVQRTPWWIPESAITLPQSPSLATFHARSHRLAYVSGSSVRIWTSGSDPNSAVTIRHNLDRVDSNVSSIAFSPGGDRVITAGSDGTAQVWDALTGVPLGSRLDHAATVRAAVFSATGKYVATASTDGNVKVWIAATGSPFAGPFLHGTTKHPDSVNSVAFSPDEKLVASASAGAAVTVWDIAAGRLLRPAILHRSAVNSVAFSPDGKSLAAACDDGTAHRWDLSSGIRFGIPLVHQKSVNFVSFSADSARLLTVTEDRAATVWDLASSESLASPLSGVVPGAAGFAGPAGRDAVAIALEASKYTLWRLSAENDVTALPPFVHQDSVNAAVFDASGSHLLTGTEGNAALLWKAPNLRPAQPLPPPAVFRGHTGAVKAVALHPGGGLLFTASSSAEDGLNAWTPRGERSFGLPGSNRLLSMAFHPASDLLAVATESNAVHLWDIRNRNRVGDLAHDGAVNSVAFSPDGRYLVSASDDMSVRVWEIPSSQPSQPPLAPRLSFKLMDAESFSSAAFSPDSSRIVTGSRDQTAQVWNVSTREKTGVVLRHGDAVYSASFSPDGCCILTASRDRTARLWDAYSGDSIGAPFRHAGEVNSASFDPTGRRIVTASRDGTARVWLALLDSRASGADRVILAQLAEALGGHTINDQDPRFHYVVPISDRLTRVSRLRLAAQTPGPSTSPLWEFIARLLPRNAAFLADPEPATPSPSPIATRK